MATPDLFIIDRLTFSDSEPKMPIILQQKDIEWRQTPTSVIIKVPLHGIHHSKADIFYCPHYIKASFQHFFYEVFLAHPIRTEDDASRGTFTSTHIVFELAKETPNEHWEDLQRNDLSKADKMTLKKDYLDQHQIEAEKAKKDKSGKKWELKRVAVREQMKLDTEQRNEIDHIRNDEKVKALEGLDKWQKQPRVARQRPPAIAQQKQKPVPRPPVRSSHVTEVEFTPRQFPTPSRESRMEEEDEWLRKQAQARRSAGFISEDIRPEERNPQYLKHKGDEFMTNKNYLGAISAYSFGIRISDKFHELFIARSEAHLALGNWAKVAQDCSAALNLMRPEVPANLRERALCIGRRGLALVNLNVVRQGCEELRASLRLVPDNEEFRGKLEEAEGRSDSDST